MPRMPNGIVLQTQADAPPGLLSGWAERRGLGLDVVRADLVSELPDPRGYAFAIVLGSSMSVVDGADEWIARVLDWLRAADAADIPVLGICFGAQALAAILGGRAFRLPTPEIGWIEVDTVDASLVPAGPWVAWHEDGFEPPPLARELARNAYGSQAFSIRGHLALQFHPEATPEIAADWDEEDRYDFAPPAGTDAAAAAERLFDGFAAQAALATA
jgi:GMP synthase-like glutamine amidotransferase